MSTLSPQDEAYIKGLKERDAAVIKEIYQSIRPKVIGFVLKNQGGEDDAGDVFQKALLQLMARVEVKDFVLQSSFEAYLFTACKNLWRRELKKRQLRGVTTDKVRSLYYEADDLAQATLEQERWELFQEKLKDLSENCQQLLRLLFNKVSGKEIREKMGYGSENTVRQRIFKCKSRLTQLILQDGRYQNLQFK
jgi:RNA polymerase sigma factor (sigma-70 family)